MRLYLKTNTRVLCMLKKINISKISIHISIFHRPLTVKLNVNLHLKLILGYFTLVSYLLYQNVILTERKLQLNVLMLTNILYKSCLLFIFVQVFVKLVTKEQIVTNVIQDTMVMELHVQHVVLTRLHLQVVLLQLQETVSLLYYQILDNLVSYGVFNLKMIKYFVMT